MASTTPITDNKKAPAPADKKKPTPTPPAEEFWLRYSPHHEFPLSSVTSVTLHILVIVLLVLGGWLAIRLGLMRDEGGLPVDAILLERGGGGGSLNGREGATGAGDLPPEAVTDPKADPNKPVNPLTLPDLPDTNVDPIRLPDFKDADGKRVIDPGAKNLAIEAAKSLNEEARTKIFGAVGDKGGGGDGSGGGTGSGKGKATGSGTGDGTKGKKLSERQKRQLRWTMIFNTHDGNDYATQLDSLGAILAVPTSAENKEFLVIRDLKTRPAEGKIEDPAALQRIYWIDDKLDSVSGLARALGIKTNPRLIIAFLPIELENKLAQMERDYKGLKEDDIAETRFDVVRTGERYEPKVTSQLGRR
jgi:hypothetical protein